MIVEKRSTVMSGTHMLTVFAGFLLVLCSWLIAKLLLRAPMRIERSIDTFNQLREFPARLAEYGLTVIIAVYGTFVLYVGIAQRPISMVAALGLGLAIGIAAVIAILEVGKRLYSLDRVRLFNRNYGFIIAGSLAWLVGFYLSGVPFSWGYLLSPHAVNFTTFLATMSSAVGWLVAVVIYRVRRAN